MTETALFRKGFGLKKEVKSDIKQDYHSELITFLISHGNEFKITDNHIFLAKDFGFCYGVDRAVEYAYQTRLKFPDRKIYLVGEIIHNPFVNNQITQMGIEILDGLQRKSADYSFLNADDVVLIPAFGVQDNTLVKLKEQNCILVDTTCGSVLSVWKRVEQYARDGFTAIVHGKYDHEETLATCSQVTKYPGGKFVVVYDKSEAQLICDFVEDKCNAEILMEKLAKTSSPDFDPEKDLQKVGCANQTTMLSSESLEIANDVEQSFVKRYGLEEAKERFRSFDTICSATQDRQDAIIELLKTKSLDLMLIIGGYNSSNTGHLVEIASQYIPSFHIEGSISLLSATEIEHKLPFKKDIVIETNWLKKGPLRIGFTAGASTPNSRIGEVLYRFLSFRNVLAESINSLIFEKAIVN